MTFDELHDYVSENQRNITGITVIRGGEIAYEDQWNGFSSDDAVHVMSVTKSVVSILIGIAIDHGLIKSVKQRVMEFFPDYTVKRGEHTIFDVTLERLLTMTAPYKYRSEPWTKVCSSDDWTFAALDLLGGRSGITGEFKYSTLGIHILTGIIARTSGMKPVDFANEYLFTPLNIPPYTNYLADTAEEHKAFILSKEPRERVWFCDPKGVGAAGYGLCMTSRDMAMLGQLCLDGGEHHGRRVVSSEWIRESTLPRINAGENFANMSYGYLWWTLDVRLPAYAALGNSGNVILIDPETRTVTAVAGTFMPNILDRVDFIRKYIIPTVTRNTPEYL